MAKLTKTFVEKVKPPANGYAMWWDDAVRGYGLRVSAAQPGTAPKKVFMVIGRVGGKSIQFSIGTFGTYTGDRTKTPRAGVVGLAPDKVVVARATDCIPWLRSDQTAEANSGRVRASFGRAPDVVLVNQYGTSTLAVPSGAIDKDAPFPNATLSRPGASALVWTLLTRFNPKGLVEINPAKVVARLPAARYTVVPEEAGLAQLIDEGALEIVGTEEEIQIGGMTIVGGGDDLIEGADGQTVHRTTVPREYLIEKPITYSAGLGGAHRAKFILARGVPQPKGDGGHSTLDVQE